MFYYVYFLDLNISNHKYCVPYLKQAYTIIEAHRSDGVYQGNLSKIMGLTKLQSRTILRNIVKTNIVATYMNDIGRQRLTKYVSKKYEKGSKLSKQFKKEIHKIKELTKQMATENVKAEKGATSIEHEKSTVTTDDKGNADEVIEFNTINMVNEKSSTEMEQETNNTTVKLQKLFYVANRILCKYRITKRPNRYKRTCFNYVSSKMNKSQTTEGGANTNNASLDVPTLTSREKASAAYKNIKVDITVLQPLKTKKPENEIYGFMEDVENSEKKNGTNITYRLLRRANMIIESVKEHQIIDDMTKLMKVTYMCC